MVKERKPGKKYTFEEAKARIPIVAKRVALQAVDLVIMLTEGERGERPPYPIDSHAVEQRIWALTGQAGYLSRLCHVVWRHEGLKRAAEQETA